MKIEIGEDNGFLFGGVPSLVVVSVLFDDGRCVRFPYPADKPINALYDDLKKVTPKDIPALPIDKIVATARFIEAAKNLMPDVVHETSKSNGIETGDFVSCVKVEDRGQGATVDLHIGGEYRVLKVNAKDVDTGDQVHHIVDGYDVIDDKAPVPVRMFVFAHEVVFVRKGNPKTKKGPMLFEEITDCPSCGDKVAAVVIDGELRGKCDKCGEFTKKKEAKSAASDKQA